MNGSVRQLKENAEVAFDIIVFLLDRVEPRLSPRVQFTILQRFVKMLFLAQAQLMRAMGHLDHQLSMPVGHRLHRLSRCLERSEAFRSVTLTVAIRTSVPGVMPTPCSAYR